jgi:hypothetical protein
MVLSRFVLVKRMERLMPPKASQELMHKESLLNVSKESTESDVKSQNVVKLFVKQHELMDEIKSLEMNQEYQWMIQEFKEHAKEWHEILDLLKLNDA